MARISVADNCHQKFSADIIEHWQKKGHEVKYEPGASEYLAQWADIYYIDWSDNNVHYLMDLYHGDKRNCISADLKKTWDEKKKPLIVVRAIDWDVWIGYARNQELVNWVDKWITIAPHIEQKLRKEAIYNPPEKLKLIRPGVNLDKFPLKTKQTDSFQIGMVLGDMWWYKNHMAGLDIFATLARKDPRWRLHIRGQHEPGEFNPVMYEYYLESRGIKDKVTLYPHVPDINAWYEGIDYLLHPGMKETFCYAVGEAMTKGIKPIVNNFYGAKDIWHDEILYNTHDEAMRMFFNGHPNHRKPDILYRQFIQEHYDVKRMCREIDEFIEI